MTKNVDLAWCCIMRSEQIRRILSLSVTGYDSALGGIPVTVTAGGDTSVPTAAFTNN